MGEIHNGCRATYDQRAGEAPGRVLGHKERHNQEPFRFRGKELGLLGAHEGPRNRSQGRRGWYTGQEENFRWMGEVGFHEWAKSTDMATTTLATLRTDGLKTNFSSWKDVLINTAMYFDLDKRKMESFANFAGIDILAIAYKEAGQRRGSGAISGKIFLKFGTFLVHFSDVNE